MIIQWISKVIRESHGPTWESLSSLLSSLYSATQLSLSILWIIPNHLVGRSPSQKMIGSSCFPKWGHALGTSSGCSVTWWSFWIEMHWKTGIFIARSVMMMMMMMMMIVPWWPSAWLSFMVLQHHVKSILEKLELYGPRYDLTHIFGLVLVEFPFQVVTKNPGKKLKGLYLSGKPSAAHPFFQLHLIGLEWSWYCGEILHHLGMVETP